MRILLLNQFYVPDVAATGQLLADLAESLVARGHEVHIVCGRSKYGGGRLSAAREEHVNGVRVHRVGTTGFGRQRLTGKAIDYLGFYVNAARRALMLPRPDVCVSLTTPPFISLIGLLLSKLKGTRNVIWMMDVYPEIAVAYGVLSREGVVCRLMSRINAALYRNAAAVVSLGEVMTEHLTATGVSEDKLYTVHNWVPGERVLVERSSVI
jgi:colanic acid biosynthesis glycosyl transferase WcaI